MFSRKPITCLFYILMMSLFISSCKVSLNEGGIGDDFASNVREEPIPEEYASLLFPYAESLIADLYKRDTSSLRKKSHPDYADMFNGAGAKAKMKLFNPKKADYSKKEYLGYQTFTTQDGLVFASLYYRIPRKNGSDNLTLSIDANLNECCRFVGFNMETSFKKSLIGKD